MHDASTKKNPRIFN